jgi:hypothetical protein
MEGLIALVINRRMKGLGFTEYSVKTKTIELSSLTKVHKNCQNEYWFLTDISDVTDDFLIQADNFITKLSQINIDGIPYTLQDFTGNLIIEKLAHTTTQYVSFARVRPKATKPEKYKVKISQSE